MTCPQGVMLLGIPCGCRGRWHESLVESAGHPPPEVPARPCDGDELPGGAKIVAKRARVAGGWFVWATYARGTKSTRERPMVDRHAVYGIHRTGRRFVIVYNNGSLVRPWRGEDGTFEACSLGELKEWL